MRDTWTAVGGVTVGQPCNITVYHQTTGWLKALIPTGTDPDSLALIGPSHLLIKLLSFHIYFF